MIMPPTPSPPRPSARRLPAPVRAQRSLIVLSAWLGVACTTVVEYEDAVDETGGVVTFGGADAGEPGDPQDGSGPQPGDAAPLEDAGPSPDVTLEDGGTEMADATLSPDHTGSGDPDASPGPGEDAADQATDGGGAAVDGVGDASATGDVPDGPEPPGPCSGDYVRLVDGALWLDGVTWRPRILDYRVEVRRDESGALSPAPQHTSCSDNLCCLGQAACADALALDLITIAGLGFEAVRVSELGLGRDGGAPVMGCVEWSPSTGFVACVPPVGLDDEAGVAAAVEVIALLLGAAADAGLRVILPVGTGDLTGADAAADHAALLAGLAAPLAGETALMSWELVADPGTGGPTALGDAASHAALVQGWYDAVRSVDGAHLISIGLSGSATLASWDPTRLPVDLVTFHPFPGASFDPAAEALFRAEYGWMMSLGVPSLVSATGLATGDAGLEAAQVDVAAAALELARACGALGQGWWTYRDRLSEDVADLPEQYGLVRVDGSQKPAAAVFGPFDLHAASGEACPQMGVSGSGGAAGVLTGRALDPTTGKPIAWARVTGTSCVDPDASTHTFTRSDGRFTLVAGFGMMQVVVAAAGYAPRDDLWPACQNVDLGDLLLSPTLAIVPPSPPGCE